MPTWLHRKLGARLLAVAAEVEAAVGGAGATLVDIGSDHGYLPAFLLRQGIVARAIAVEKTVAPFEKARQALCRVNADVRLGDGLAPVQIGEADVLTMTGFGGLQMARILRNHPRAVPPVVIVQPLNYAAALREWATEQGFASLADEVVDGYRILRFEAQTKKDAPKRIVPGRPEARRMSHSAKEIRRLLQFHFQAHPWHGISAYVGEDETGVREKLNVYVELTPTDGVKYELDKNHGHIKVDRPQKYSNLCPTLYGFVPRTYCAEEVGAHCSKQIGRPGIAGDGDPLDICVLTEKPISHVGILITAIPIGGIRMIDAGQADDKILAVLANDVTYGGWRSISDVPKGLIDRVRQYFLTYKQSPDALEHPVEVTHVYDREEALEIITASQNDYKAHYGSLQTDLAEFLHNLALTVSNAT